MEAREEDARAHLKSMLHRRRVVEVAEAEQVADRDSSTEQNQEQSE